MRTITKLVWVGLIFGLAGIVCVTGCVSPFYGTARIEKGVHVDAGIAATSYIAGVGECCSHFLGARGDVEIKYGFNPYFQLNARLGFGSGVQGMFIEAPPHYRPRFIDPAAGIQTSIPVGPVTPALRLEVSPSTYFYFPTFIVAVLVGFGRKEWLTIGGAFRPDVNTGGPSVFATIHPFDRISVFFGVDPTSIRSGRPLLGSVGVGYKIK